MTVSVLPEDILALGWRYLDQMVTLCSLTEQQARSAASEDPSVWDALERERHALLDSLDRLQYGIQRLSAKAGRASGETEAAWKRCLEEIRLAAERLSAADAAVEIALERRCAALEDSLDRLRGRQWTYVCYADAPRLGMQANP